MNKFYYNHIKQHVYLLDIVFLNFAMALGHYLVFGNFHFNFSSRTFFVLTNLCWALISFFNKNYRIYRPVNINDIFDKFLMTLIYQLFLVLGVIYFFKITDISRSFVLISLCVFSLMVMLLRIGLVYFLGKKSTDAVNNHVIIIGNERIAQSLKATFEAHPEFGYNDYEYLGCDPELLTGPGYLKSLSKQHPAEIFVCFKEMNIETLDSLIVFGNENNIKIKVVYDVISKLKRQKGNFDNLPILHLDTRPIVSKKIQFLKRVFDILFASTVMFIGSPIFGVILFITKVTSKGKAFYKQERIGQNEKPFYIYKFRSMYVDAERLGPQLSKDNDPRITKWGMMMRKTRLDELPQFWNVLKGEMSIVGYRPERRHFIEQIAEKTPEYKRLLNHKPGITSLGQVHYGYAENIDQMCERLRFDLLYFCDINLNSDVSIILKTVKVMVQGKGK